MVAETAEVNNPKNLQMLKSGFELVEILEIQIRSCFTVQLIRILDGVRNMQAAKNVQAVVSSTPSKNDTKNTADKLCHEKGATIRQHEDAWHQRLLESIQESRLGEGAS